MNPSNAGNFESITRDQKIQNITESNLLKMKKRKKEAARTDIPRREALKKAGIYVAFTAVASLMFLTPKKAQADSPVDPGWG
jgi:hypothetical protein